LPIVISAGEQFKLSPAPLRDTTIRFLGEHLGGRGPGLDHEGEAFELLQSNDVLMQVFRYHDPLLDHCGCTIGLVTADRGAASMSRDRNRLAEHIP
jgi:hypothetical protein